MPSAAKARPFKVRVRLVRNADHISPEYVEKQHRHVMPSASAGQSYKEAVAGSGVVKYRAVLGIKCVNVWHWHLAWCGATRGVCCGIE